MEKLLGFYDTLNKLNTNSQFNVLLIIPVITVFFGAILVFVCGFRKAEEPKFKKISDGMNNSNPSKSKAKRKTNTNNNVNNNQNGNVIQKPNSNEAIQLKKISSNTTKKQQQNKPGGVSSSTSTQQMATSTNASNKKNENDSRKDNSSLKKSSNQQQQPINQNSSKTVSNKKLVADNTLKNHKEEVILNNKINKKGKSNTNKNQTVEGDGWQTVQSRTDKKNKKTENETFSSQSPANVVQQLNSIGIIVPGNLTPKSPRKKPIDIKNKQISVSTTNTTTIALKTSPIKDNTTDNNKLAESVDIENNKNLDNVIDNNKKPTAVKQQTNQFSLPTYMTKEEFHEFVTRNSTATVLSNDTGSSVNDTEKMSPITIDNKSTPHSNEMQIAEDDNKLTYHLQNKISSDVNQLDALLDSSSVNQKQSNEKSSAATKNAALSFIENEKLISELGSKANENVAFDELGDAWTETKTQKKNKKRVRKE